MKDTHFQYLFVVSIFWFVCSEQSEICFLGIESGMFELQKNVSTFKYDDDSRDMKLKMVTNKH